MNTVLFERDVDHGEAVVAELMAPARTIEIWPGHRYALSQAEAALIATPAFQRLTRLRQMGLAIHAFPNAENTRASHSLGVAYWSSRILEALGDTADRGGGLSARLLVRLFALLHDIDLLPLGHTLRYQSNILIETPAFPRMIACVNSIWAHVEEHGLIQAPRRDAALACFERHLRAAAEARPGHPDPSIALASEVVNSMLGADLFDFALRDSFAIGREQKLHGDYPEMLSLVTHNRRRKLAIRADKAAVAEDLYRARYEVFAQSVNHPRKLAADAMLDRIIRRIEAGCRDPRWSDRHLMTLGDDEFLTLVAALEAQLDDGLALASALQLGLLHEEIFRHEDLPGFAKRPDAERALALDPLWRTEAEAAILARLPMLRPGDVIVAVSPGKMQVKLPDVLLAEPDGTLYSLAKLPDTPVNAIAAAYASLWSLRVYLAPACLDCADDVSQIAASLSMPDARPW